MNDRGTYDGVPTRLKVADVFVNYGKDISFTRSGLIKSPFRDERTPSFHMLAGGYGWVDFGDGTKCGVIDLVMRLEHCDGTFVDRAAEELGIPRGRVSVRNTRPDAILQMACIRLCYFIFAILFLAILYRL